MDSPPLLRFATALRGRSDSSSKAPFIENPNLLNGVISDLEELYQIVTDLRSNLKSTSNQTDENDHDHDRLSASGLHLESHSIDSSTSRFVHTGKSTASSAQLRDRYGFLYESPGEQMRAALAYTTILDEQVREWKGATALLKICCTCGHSIDYIYITFVWCWYY